MSDTEREALCARIDELCAEVEQGKAEFKKMDAWHSQELKAAMDENAKLRELVLDMWRFTGTACKKYPRLFDPAAQGGQAVQLNMIDAFEQRMRELGIEVD